MRVVYRVFADGSKQVYTTENGGGNMQFIEGDASSRPVGVRKIIASVEAVYDDAQRDSLIDALHKIEGMLPVPA